MSRSARWMVLVLLPACTEVAQGIGEPGAPTDMIPDSTPEPGPDESESVDAAACLSQPERALSIESPANELELALPDSISERSILQDGSGAKVGLVFFDVASGVAGFAIARSARALDVESEARAVRAEASSVGILSGEQDRRLITWDGFDGATTQASFAHGGASAVELAGRLAEAIAGEGALSGQLPGDARLASAFTLLLTTLFRAEDVVVIGAIAPEPLGEAALILAGDLSNGSAVARSGDFTETVCDPRVTPPGHDLIDFLWVVDNSRSMGEEQVAVADSGEQMVSLLSSTQLSWRLALTTTDRIDGSLTAAGVFGFTPSGPEDVATSASRAWAEAVGALGTDGSGDERGAESGIAAARSALPASSVEDPLRFREGASVVVVHLSDEEDFSVKVASGGEDLRCPENAGKQTRIDQLVGEYQELGRDRSIAGLHTYAIHSIRPNVLGADYCDYLMGSADCPRSQFGRAYVDIASATGGGAGSICGDMGEIVQEIVRTGAGIASQIELSRPPISSTLDVVVADEAGRFAGQPLIARSRSNGFDYAFDLDRSNGRIHHKVVFYGDSRPLPDRAIKIRYRAWKRGASGLCGDPCGEGEQCLDGICVPMQPDPCNAACTATQYCDATSGVCKELF